MYNKLKKLRFKSKEDYEKKLNELRGFEERNYLDTY